MDYLTVNNGYGHNVLVKENFYDTNIYFSFNNKHLDNYSLPDGALFEEGVKKPTLSNSDYKNQNFNLGLTFPREWGYFGIAFDNVDSVYGIPYHAHEGRKRRKRRKLTEPSLKLNLKPILLKVVITSLCFSML